MLVAMDQIAVAEKAKAIGLSRRLMSSFSMLALFKLWDSLRQLV